MEKLLIHYYFSDDSHSMNAFVRNKAEKEVLDLIKNVGSVMESDVFIETEAFQEGGLKEVILIGFLGTVGFLQSSINDLVTYHLITDEEQKTLDKKIKREQLEGLKIDNAKKKRELEAQLSRVIEDKKSKRFASNFYTNLANYKKITRVGFKVDNQDNEMIIHREKFEKFILHDEKDVVEHDEAIIEVFSPVLNESKAKWRGLFNGEKIDFSMGDSGFKKEVIERQHTFINGVSIKCFLVVTITYDEFGDEKRRNYSVKKVYGITSPRSDNFVVRKSGHRKFQEKSISSQIDIFDESNN